MFKKIIFAIVYLSLAIICVIGIFHNPMMIKILPEFLVFGHIGIDPLIIGLISGGVCGIILIIGSVMKIFDSRKINKIIMIGGIIWLILIIIFAIIYAVGLLN